MAKSPFTSNPLYRSLERRAIREAQQSWRATSAYKMMEEVRQVSRNVRHPSALIRSQTARKIKQLKGRLTGKAIAQELMGAPIGGVVRDVQRYAKNGVTKSLIDSLINELGPVGSLIRALVKKGKPGGTLSRDIDSALEFIRAVRPEALAQPKRRRKAPTVGELSAELDRAREKLEDAGFEVQPRDKPKPSALPFGIPEETKAGKPRKRVKLDMGNGRMREFPRNHPIVTGDMVPTPESSNVHSYGYDIESQFLYVRFKAPSQGKGPRPQSPGPLYQYAHFQPDKFLKMLAAPSKGTFLWDKIRIRGTLSGHRYDYQLVGVMGNYVPRKATLMPDGEWFLQRTVRTTKGRLLTSRLGDMLARPLGQPNRGLPPGPNRGEPNRGTPNRG